jgi:hypothetical protein
MDDLALILKVRAARLKELTPIHRELVEGMIDTGNTILWGMNPGQKLLIQDVDQNTEWVFDVDGTELSSSMID